MRLVCQRLPPAVAAERRRKAKANAQKDGRRGSPSQRYLQLLDWAIFITNVRETQLSIAQVILVYRLRWQIELIFKLWKSRAHLRQIGNWRAARVLCQLYARLIGLLLFHWSISTHFTTCKSLSLPKAFGLFKYHVPKLVASIANRWLSFESTLSRIDRDILRLAPQDKRKKSPSTFQLLVQAGL